MRPRKYISQVGIEGALLVLSPFPLLFPIVATDTLSKTWQLMDAALSTAAFIACAVVLFRKPLIGKILGSLAIIGCYIAALPYILTNPFAALTATVAFVGGLFFFADFRPHFQKGKKLDQCGRREQRAWWGASTIPMLIFLNLFLGTSSFPITSFILFVSFIIVLILYSQWVVKTRSALRIFFAVSFFLLTVISYLFLKLYYVPSIILVFSLSILLSFPHKLETFERRKHLWEIFLSHPARVLLTTFLCLCLLGTFLLALPASTHGKTIELIDAAFTSVSAVCVTGLIVLDTPNDFTFFGQFCILLLIQLGGLGIMSIATFALYAMGKRLSLRQERVLTSLTDTDHKTLFHSLKIILLFTAVAEVIGALSLTLLFQSAGDPFPQAAWRGIFTSISAFCNAGFALQSDSLIPYQTHPLILHVVSTLIIFGGMAPATSLLTHKWIAGKPVPIPVRITLITTIILLVSGTFLVLAFEWDGILAGLSINDKIQNAWFQSVTLRTAGFNSVELATIASPTFLVMIAFMFIGGSPGGTAGGVKTTTIGILAMGFWANITNRNDVRIQNRRIHSSTILRAITIVISGMVVWFVVVLMLLSTQQISARNLIFEATSALGTVGLTTGATPLLDGIGKIIIIITMFVGRIGPMSLFMLLSDKQEIVSQRCPVEKISLT